MNKEFAFGGVAFLFAAGVRWIMPEADIGILVGLGIIGVVIGAIKES